jgi:hypothetical protein
MAGVSLPAAAVAPSTSQDAQYSTRALTQLNYLEAAIAAAGACGLPASSLSNLVSAVVASPLAAAAQPRLSPTTVCANINAVADTRISGSALTSMWAWGNSVSPSQDARGLGEAAFVPQTIAAYSAAKKLDNVRLSVPWAADQGDAIRSWVGATVAALRANGQTVSALGGDAQWVSNPSLVSQWITAAHAAAAFTSIQLDVEPWVTTPNWTTNPAAIASYVALVSQAQATAHSLGLTLGIDAPWWLSTTPYLSGTVLSALLPHVDTVSIVAFSDHAGGTDGIIAQAWPAVEQASATLTPFTIGVQTSSDTVSGGAQYTFADKGSAALESESAKVRAAYAAHLGYSGVTVEEYLSWRSLGK